MRFIQKTHTSSAKKKIFRSFHGFTLVELLVSVSIFVIMTTLLVTKYGNFNQSVLLTNLAYDVAVTIRTAQTYGLSVKNVDASTDFVYGYGVHFSAGDQASDATQQIAFFQDVQDTGILGSNTYEIHDTYTIKRGAFVSEVCAGSSEDHCDVGTSLDITFKRPDPNAIICLDDACSSYKFAKITVQGSDGSLRYVTVRENGQISVVE